MYKSVIFVDICVYLNFVSYVVKGKGEVGFVLLVVNFLMDIIGVGELVDSY